MVDQPTPLPEELAQLEEDDPRTIGPFEVIGRLGAGGMGVVYGAIDGTGQCVAVKVIHPAFAEQVEYRERFEREVDLLRGLDAECVPAFLGADPHADLPWMATEFVAGRTLSEYVREFGPLSGAALHAFAAGTAEAIVAIHEADVIHRDIKPGNVILSPDGPKILDFGIARGATESTPEQGVHGTPGYLPPERLAGEPSSSAGDVFAWGGMVAFAATGRHPFGRGETQEVLRRVRAGEYDLIGVPDDLRELVVRALGHDPVDRPTAAEAFRQSLQLAMPTVEVLSADAIDTVPTTEEERGRLVAVLGRAWTGFDAAGHDPRAWVALGSATAGVGTAAGLAALMRGGTEVKGSGAAASKPAPTTVESGGQIGGMTSAGGSATGLSLGAKTAIGVGAVFAAGALVTGGYVLAVDNDEPDDADQVAEEQGDSAPDPDDEVEGGNGEGATQDAEYRGMTLPVPEDWGVYELTDSFTTADLRDAGTDDWVVLVPEGDPGCDEETPWQWSGDPEVCPHVAVLGPAAIELGWYNPDQGFHAGSEIEPCPAELVDSGRGSSMETISMGGREAEHHTFEFPCMDDTTQRTYTQDVWFVADEEILIVDRWSNPDLPELLAEAQW